MPGPQPVLQLRGIRKAFPGVQALEDVSLDIYPGEVHCLVGENGAGKSTLIKILAGAFPPDAGTITYQGRPVDHANPRWARDHGIITVFQELDLVPVLSVAENIFLGSEPVRRTGAIDWAAMRRRARELLDEIGVPLDVNAPVHSLSVAQQQMVALARALASADVHVLILDEPTAVFTDAEVRTLFRIVRRLKDQGVAVLYISHHLDEIFQIGDRITVLRDGRLVRQGAVADFDRASLIRAMVGRDLGGVDHSGPSPGGEELLRVERLRRQGVLREVRLVLRRGEIVGVAGLVGAGRTEMARAIVGADPVDEAEVYVRGTRVRIRSPRQALALGIGLVPESRKEEGLVLGRPVLENAAYSAVAATARAGLVRWARVRAWVRELLGRVQVRPSDPGVLVRHLSGGNQQKVVLAKWLAARCEVLILDEPTRGVDVGAKEEIYKLMQQLKREGRAILMISSELPEVLAQSDRVLVMAGGRIVAELGRVEATEERVLTLAFQGGASGS